jgi:hypothetical protein
MPQPEVSWTKLSIVSLPFNGPPILGSALAVTVLIAFFAVFFGVVVLIVIYGKLGP